MDRAGPLVALAGVRRDGSYNLAGDWTARYYMTTMHGKRDGFTLADFRARAQSARMNGVSRAEAIVEEVRAAAVKWPEYAERAQVMKTWRQQIQRNLRRICLARHKKNRSREGVKVSGILIFTASVPLCFAATSRFQFTALLEQAPHL